MAIPSTDLALWRGNTSITGQSGRGSYLGLSWEARHRVTGDTIGRGTLSRAVAIMGQLQDVDAAMQAEAEGAYAGVVEWHKPIAAIGDYSAFDADLILDGWMQNGGAMEHPICGSISGAPVGLVQRVLAILADRLPPTQWWWAESTTAGQLRVKYQPVAGAAGYNVYGGLDASGGETLLGTVTGTGWKTLTVPAGFYSVRIAPVGAEIGILSFAIGVEVA